MTRPSSRTFAQRLADGVVMGAEGYVFELERRGYVKAGPYVPEVILDEPDALRQLHREFLRAGADVMVALTYYAHREKLRDVGRDGDLRAIMRAGAVFRSSGKRSRCASAHPSFGSISSGRLPASASSSSIVRTPARPRRRISNKRRLMTSGELSCIRTAESIAART